MRRTRREGRRSRERSLSLPADRQRRYRERPMPTFQAPRGMRDLLPEEAAGFDSLQAVVLARAARYGYPRIDTPVVEDRKVFVKASGEASDIASHEMYDVAHGGE